MITEVDDVHADAVISHLNERRVPVFRLHTSAYPSTTSISLEVRNGTLDGEVVTADRRLALDRVACAWLRRPGTPTVDAHLDPAATEYALTQSRDLLHFLNTVLGDAWIGHPNRLRTAEVKPLQLLRASAAGLRTPETLITNDPARVRHFFGEVGAKEYAVKPIRLLGVDTAEGWHFPLTTTVRYHQDLPGVEFAPTIFQPYIAKAFEVRCVVIGSEVFAARINSQDLPETMTDWRGGDAKHELHHLPPEVADSSVELVRSFGLNFASMDFIVTPAGDHVFVEMNPNGQFLWLEYELGLPLSSKVADLLCSLRSSSAQVKVP